MNMSTKDRGESNSDKEAFLVRRSIQDHASSSRGSSQSRPEARGVNAAGKWLLREQPRSREVSGSSDAANATKVQGMTGISDGVGVDARKRLEVALQLTL